MNSETKIAFFRWPSSFGRKSGSCSGHSLEVILKRSPASCGVGDRARRLLPSGTSDNVKNHAVFGPANRDEKSGNTLGKLVCATMRENPCVNRKCGKTP